MSEDVTWTGRIDRCVDGSLLGRIVDVNGWEIILTGVRDPEQGGYVLTGRVGEMGTLRQPFDDNQ